MNLKEKEIMLNRNESISKLRLGEKYFLSKDVKQAVLEFKQKYKDLHKVCLNPSDLRDNEILLNNLIKEIFGEWAK